MLAKGLPKPRPPPIPVNWKRVLEDGPCDCSPRCTALLDHDEFYCTLHSDVERCCHSGFAAALLASIPPAARKSSSKADVTSLATGHASDGLLLNLLGPDLLCMILIAAGPGGSSAAARTCHALRDAALRDDVSRAHLEYLFNMGRFKPQSVVHQLIARQLLTSATCGAPGTQPLAGGWRELARAGLEVCRAWDWQERLLARRRMLDEQFAALQRRDADAARRLSGLQMSDYREAQRDRPPDPDLTTAALLLHAVLGETSAGSESANGGTAPREVEAAAVEWLRREALPSIGQSFGEHAQLHVAPFLDRCFKCGGDAEWPLPRLRAVGQLLPRVCVRRLDDRMRLELRQCVPASGPTPACRVLRVSSAITRWVLHTAHKQDVARARTELAGVMLHVGRGASVDPLQLSLNFASTFGTPECEVTRRRPADDDEGLGESTRRGCEDEAEDSALGERLSLLRVNELTQEQG